MQKIKILIAESQAENEDSLTGFFKKKSDVTLVGTCSTEQKLLNVLKVSIGLSMVGVITGEFLVSKAGLGYLIVYGGQVFKLDLVMTSVIILGIVATLMYHGIVLLEKIINSKGKWQ